MCTLVVDVPVVDAREDMFQDSFNFLSYLYKSYAAGRARAETTEVARLGQDFLCYF